MAGYMGFGMQTWVFKRRPRKPFTKGGRISSFYPLHQNLRTFKPKPKVKENSKGIELILALAVIILSLSIFMWINDFVEYSEQHRISVEKSMLRMEDKAFTFLMASGKQELMSNDIAAAYSEFILAYKIRPEDEEVNQLLIETLSMLCAENIKHCIELEEFLNRSI